MAKFQLQENETLIGSGSMAYHEIEGKFRKRLWNGNIYITNQRAVFLMSMTGINMVELPLSEIEGFLVSKGLLFTAVIICSRDGKTFKFTGFPVKKLQGWLEQVDVKKLEQ